MKFSLVFFFLQCVHEKSKKAQDDSNHLRVDKGRGRKFKTLDYPHIGKSNAAANESSLCGQAKKSTG